MLLKKLLVKIALANNMDNEYKISKGSSGDLFDIWKFNYAIFKKIFKKEPFSLEKYRERLSDKNPSIRIIKYRGSIIGDSVAYKKGDDLYIWILSIGVKYRNKGLATRLLKLNEKFAKKGKLKSVTVKVYNVSTEMQRLLIKNRYIPEKIEKYPEDSRYNAIHFRLNF
jgi:RimJ/RimL family protein N-acetyltransferase